MNVSAQDVRRALGGVPIGGGFLCRCPVTGHGKGKGDRNPSLSVSDGDRGLVYHCFAGCEARAIFEVLEKLDVSREALPIFAAREPPKPKTTIADALALWRAAGSVADTPGEKYLAARGLPLPPASVRFLRNVAFSPTRKFDCLVQGLQAVTRELVAVQLTFLHPSRPEKAPVARPRRMIGRSRGAALRLAAPARVLGLTESFENAQALTLMTSLPLWASCGAERMPLVKLPDIVENLIVFADPDLPGLLAAQKVRENNRHINVEIRSPDGEDDYAAIWQAGSVETV